MNASRVFLGFVIAGLITSNASATVRRVNDESTAGWPDGSNWTSQAYPFLQDALDDSQSGDEVWVKEGIYYPDDGDSVTSGEKTESFALESGVAIYGGFVGNEQTLSDRPKAGQGSPSVLNGDIDHDDTLDADNTYHIVDGFGTDSTAVLDRFTIKLGYAIGDANPPTGRSPNGGGLVVCDEVETDPFDGHGSPTIRDCLFTDNKAERGGAAYNFQGDAAFEDCTFTDNIATLHSGAVYTSDKSQSSAIHTTRLLCLFMRHASVKDLAAD